MARVVLSLTFLLVLSAGAGDIDRLRQKLAREDDPGKRAKITVKIGVELLKQTRRLYRSEEFTQAEAKLGEYLEAVSGAYRELNESGRQARRQPRGFKELEIHLRKSRRTLTALARSVPFSYRGPLDKTMQDLRAMRSDLLHQLMDVDPPKEKPGKQEER